MITSRNWYYRAGLSVAIALSLASNCVRADFTDVNVSVYETGEVRVWEAQPKATSLDESLINLAFAWGGAQWRLDPLLTMLQLIINTEDGTSDLNIEEFESFLRSPPSTYQTIVASSIPLTFEVDDDGTIERFKNTPVPLAEIRRSFARLGIFEEVSSALTMTDPVNLKILKRWLDGAQQMARSNQEIFYSNNPVLRKTRIIESFQQLSVRDLIEFITIQSKLYDVGAIVGILSTVPTWLDPRPLNPQASVSRASFNRKTRQHQFPNLGMVKAVGASNGAAYSANGRCIAQGEPHQPYSEITRAKIFQIFPSTRAGATSPALFMAQGASPTPMLSYSQYHSTSGTAGPTFGGLIFYSATNGSRYLKEGNEWGQFSQKQLNYSWANQQRSVTVTSVPEFGDIFARLTKPDDGGQFVVSFRPKTVASVADAFIGRLRFGINNDPINYKRTVEAGGLQFYGEAGCHPSDGDGARAYAALNQGRTDRLADESDIGQSSFLPSMQKYRKVGSYDTPTCFNQRWASTDNGPIRASCEVPPANISNLRDPGLPTFRQQQFKHWANEHREARADLSDPLLVRFLTSTSSNESTRIVAALRRAAELVLGEIPSLVSRAKIGSFIQELDSYEGGVHDTAAQLKLFHVVKRLLKREVPPSAKPQLEALLSTLVSDEEAMATIDSQLANALLDITLSAINFYEQRCLPRGVDTWSKAVNVTIDGDVQSMNSSGPSPNEARSVGNLDFAVINGEAQCSVIMTSSSPFSFIASESEIYYRTFGTSVSPFTVESKLYQKSSAKSIELLKNINQTGTGSSSLAAYSSFSLAEGPNQPGPGEVRNSYTARVSFTSSQDLVVALNTLRSKLIAIKRAFNDKNKRRLNSSLRAAKAVVAGYFEDSIDFVNHAEIKRLTTKISRSSHNARTLNKKSALKNAERAIKSIKRLKTVINN